MTLVHARALLTIVVLALESKGLYYFTLFRDMACRIHLSSVSQYIFRSRVVFGRIDFLVLKFVGSYYKAVGSVTMLRRGVGGPRKSQCAFI